MPFYEVMVLSFDDLGRLHDSFGNKCNFCL